MFSRECGVSNRERPVRHLVAISSDLAKTKPGADRGGARTVLCDDDPVFVLYRVAVRFGLPVVPDVVVLVHARTSEYGKQSGHCWDSDAHLYWSAETRFRFLSGWEGSEARINSNPGRERLDHVEIADDFPSNSHCEGSRRCKCDRLERAANRGEEGGAVQIVLKVWSSNSHRGRGFDYAVVEGKRLS